jgi:serine/threonine-protein kinase
MKVCPSCNTEYDDGTKFCLEDGTRTVDKEQKAKDALIGQFVDKDRHFQVVSLLGEGGMGKVYKGRQEAVGRDVAIKTLHKELLDKEQIAKRFQREARAASKLRHQNAIEVFAFGQIEAPKQPFDGMPYMVMEFVSGKSLHKTIQEAGKLTEARATHIMLQVCDVLEEAHTQGIIHRDLKPENIVLTERSRNKDFVKVLDFGIAKLLQEEEAGGTKLTKAGTVFGTPEYLSPEQASGTAVDHRSDIYSLGIILYEMLSGKVPFHADTAVGLLIKHVNEAPKPLREFAPSAGISEGMERIVMKALAKDPAERQQSVAELGDALRALSAPVPARAAAAAVLPATMIPGGPPPGVAAPRTTNPPVLPATMVPSGPPPGTAAPAPSARANHAAPVTAQVNPAPRTLEPMVLSQSPAQAKGGGGAVWAAVALAVLLGGGGAGAYFFYLKDHPEFFGGAPLQATPAAPSQAQATSPAPVTAPPVAQANNAAPAPLSPPNPAQAPTAPSPVQPPAAAQVTLKFDSSPRGAEVLLNGALIGVTPAEFAVPSSPTPIKIEIRKTGFASFTQEVIPSPSLPPIAAKLVEEKAAISASVPPKANNNGTSNSGTTPKPGETAPSTGVVPVKPAGESEAEKLRKKELARQREEEAERQRKKDLIKKKLEGGGPFGGGN